MDAEEFRYLLSRQTDGYSLEQPFYTSPAVFEREWSAIWSRYWLFAGTTADIPRPGDYFTYAIGTESVIIIRGDHGSIHALHNTCRHRGSLICLSERGHTPKLMCPYHQWVYDKDGRLLKARLMPEDFDTSKYSLHSIPVRECAGLLFISFSDSPPDFSSVIKDYTPFLDVFRISQAKVACRKRYELRTNWKLIAENFRECYHCGPAHPEYCSAVIGANLRESSAAVVQERTDAWTKKGLAVNPVEFKDDSFHFAIRYPLRPGVDSYSLDGKPVSVPMGSHKDYDAGVLGLVTYPNFWMDAVSDYMWTMRITPVSPSRTVLDLAWLVDGSAVENVDYTLPRLTEFWRITGEQDWQLCENNFRGIESSAYTPGPYAPAESEVRSFINWYLQRMADTVEEAVNH